MSNYILGIDVSENNGEYIDWNAVVNRGVKFVVVRSSYGLHSVDEMFKENVINAQNYGLLVDAYHYSYALDEEDAVQEARNAKEYITECGVGIGRLIIDFEDADSYKERHGFNFTVNNCTNICKAFLDELGNWNKGLYASYSYLQNLINWESLNCPVWNAQWMPGYDPEPDTDYDDIKGLMWQFTDKLDIGGQLFDGNIKYIE